MRHAFALALAWPLLAAGHPSEPYSFKEWKLGSSIEEARSNPAFKCENVRSPVADVHCAQTGGLAPSIAGVDAGGLSLFYLRDQLATIAVRFKSADFERVSAALIERWGPPTEQRQDSVRTRAGVSYANDILTWRNGTSRIAARRYTTNINDAGVTFSMDSVLETMRDRQKQEAKERAKDL